MMFMLILNIRLSVALQLVKRNKRSQMERESMHLQKLRDGRYIVVNKHEGEIKVHVRICNKVDSGELVPTKKGICMGSKRFASFLLHEPNVAKFVQSIQDDD